MSTTTAPSNNTYITESAPTTSSAFPAWFAEMQQQAWQTFLDTPMPTRRDESWRFGNLKQLDFSTFVQDENEDIHYDLPEVPEGVVCLPFAEALQKHGDLVQEHFMKNPTTLGSAKYAALHQARVKSGVFVYVPDGVKVDKPIEITYTLTGSNKAIFPHTLVVTGVNAEVSVLDRFVSANQEDEGLCIAVNDLIAGEGSTLKYCAVQDLNLYSRMIQVNATTVEKDANALTFILNVGARWVRNESLSRLVAEGAHSDMLSCSIPSETQEYDQRTYQHHAAQHTYSDLLYKNTLYAHAKTVFSGIIFVDENAHYTDAYQTCRNLMMSDTAEANSMPGLKINADQVKCSHGSTASSIDDEEIYYLCARGIPPRQARRLIAMGYSSEAIDRLKNDRLIEAVHEAVERKFSTIS